MSLVLFICIRWIAPLFVLWWQLNCCFIFRMEAPIVCSLFGKLDTTFLQYLGLMSPRILDLDNGLFNMTSLISWTTLFKTWRHFPPLSWRPPEMCPNKQSHDGWQIRTQSETMTLKLLRRLKFVIKGGCCSVVYVLVSFSMQHVRWLPFARPVVFEQFVFDNSIALMIEAHFLNAQLHHQH